MVASSDFIDLLFNCNLNELRRYLGLLWQMLLCVLYDDLVSWGDFVAAVLDLSAAVPAILYIAHYSEVKSEAEVKQA